MLEEHTRMTAEHEMRQIEAVNAGMAGGERYEGVMARLRRTSGT